MKTFELDNLKDFNLEHILECGQCFRWKKESDSSYTGVIKNGVVNIKMLNSQTARIKCELVDNDTEYVRSYFDLETDYALIKEKVSFEDSNMKEAIKYGYGIRILKQDSWEMLISYIISAANNIPRISKTVDNLARTYGKKIVFDNKEYFLFPTPEELSRASVEDLRRLNLGFRDKYVFEATRRVANGEINLEDIMKMTYKDAKKSLMEIQGVGAKVADCILLFSMEKEEAFPVDTWIKKVMTSLYGTKNTLKSIEKCAQTRFGAYAGIAQQYLFYYMRENN